MNLVEVSKCRTCYGPLKVILDLGRIPHAGSFPLKPVETDSYGHTLYPINVCICTDCSTVQTHAHFDPIDIFTGHEYISSVGLKNYYNILYKYIDMEVLDTHPSRILEIGCSDAQLLSNLSQCGHYTVGYEPSKKVSKIAKEKHPSVNIVNDFFSKESLEERQEIHSFDLVISTNSFAYMHNINEVADGIASALKPQSGRALIEVHSLASLVTHCQYDNIYHQHIFYNTVNSLSKALEPLHIIAATPVEIHSGSIRVLAASHGLNVSNLKDDEQAIDSIMNGTFAKNVYSTISKHQKIMEDLRNSTTKHIVGYGASGRANNLINILGIQDTINYVVDESPGRYGKYIANSNIPIVPLKDMLLDSNIGYIVILAWNFANQIKEKLAKFGEYKFINLFED
jgi:2-polyprenyl-3-methyl-5-hydroxy-6-metoxy-1,4-benzoquinol methylase